MNNIYYRRPRGPQKSGARSNCYICQLLFDMGFHTYNPKNLFSSLLVYETVLNANRNCVLTSWCSRRQAKFLTRSGISRDRTSETWQ